MKVRVKCHSVLAFEQNNRIVNALCAALAHTSKTILGGELKKAYLLWRSVLFFSHKKGHLLLQTESLLKNISVLFLISSSPPNAFLRLVFTRAPSCCFCICL